MKDLLSFNSQNERLGAAAQSEMTAQLQRRRGQQNRIAAEMSMDAKAQRDDYTARDRARLTDQNAKLAMEIERRRALEERKEREIQRICNESEELKHLEERLKVAYMNKERAAQHAERLKRDSQEAIRNQAIDDQMEYDRQMGIRREAEKDAYRRATSLQQKATLQEQMLHRQVLMKEAADEAARDRQLVDNIVNKIAEEDRLENEELNRRKEETRNMVAAYAVQREADLAERRRKEKAEQEEIAAYYASVGNREAAVRQQAEDKKDAETRAFNKIVEETERKRREEEELRQLRDELLEEELEAARIKKEADRKAKLHQSRVDMMAANEMQKQMKRRMMEDDKREEDRLIGIMQAKFQEDEARERAKAEHRAKMKAEHMDKIEEQKQQRRDMYAAEMERERQELADDTEYESFRLDVVNEARRRLLQEHGQKLRGFLPKGALQTDAELELLNQFDVDGDGNLDARELEAAQRQFMRYDADGDGKLDEDEKQDAFEALRGGAFNG